MSYPSSSAKFGDGEKLPRQPPQNPYYNPATDDDEEPLPTMENPFRIPHFEEFQNAFNSLLDIDFTLRSQSYAYRFFRWFAVKLIKWFILAPILAPYYAVMNYYYRGRMVWRAGQRVWPFIQWSWNWWTGLRMRQDVGRDLWATFEAMDDAAAEGEENAATTASAGGGPAGTGRNFAERPMTGTTAQRKKKMKRKFLRLTNIYLWITVAVVTCLILIFTLLNCMLFSIFLLYKIFQ